MPGYRALANLMGLRAGEDCELSEKEAEPYVLGGLLQRLPDADPPKRRRAAAAKPATDEPPESVV